MTPALSVILCTHNRAPLLESALDALCNQAPGTPEWEIIVVDNASTDSTPHILRRWAQIHRNRIKAVREARLGLSFARNTGIAAAAAPILAFTDDDVCVARDWVKTIVERLSGDAEYGWMGGRVLPRWPTAPPPWLTRGRWAPVGLQDHGGQCFAVGAGRPVCLIGANLAVRASVVRDVGGFDPDLQRVGDGVGSTEDHEFQERVWRRGLTGRYDPSMVVEAVVDPVRLTRTYHRRWHLGHGAFVARMGLPEIEAYGGRRWLGVPLHLLRSTNPWFALGFAVERLRHGSPQQCPAGSLTSIVIPCYNQREFLAEAVASALAQPSSEVIIVDDGSTDGSAEVASRFVAARLLRQPNRGLAAARNAGLHAARGEFILFLDSDDRLRPGAVPRLRSALEAAPTAAFAFGRFAMIDGAGAAVPATPPVRLADEGYVALLRSNFICAPGTVLYRRDALLARGGFRRGDGAADYDLYLRLARRSEFVAIAAIVADYRAHAGGMSRRAALMLRHTLRAHARARRELRNDVERRAWREGRSYWRMFYGSQLANDVRRLWHGRRWLALGRSLLVLARYAPGVLLAVLEPRLSRIQAFHRTRYTAKRPSS